MNVPTTDRNLALALKGAGLGPTAERLERLCEPSRLEEVRALLLDLHDEALSALGSSASPSSVSEDPVQALAEWLTRYGQILAATDKLLHEIRACSNADEMWRMIGFSQDVEDLHSRVIYEADAAENALSALGSSASPSSPSASEAKKEREIRNAKEELRRYGFFDDPVLRQTVADLLQQYDGFDESGTRFGLHINPTMAQWRIILHGLQALSTAGSPSSELERLVKRENTEEKCPNCGTMLSGRTALEAPERP